VLDLAGSEGESALTDELTKEMSESEITDRRLEAWCINHGLSEIQEMFKDLKKRQLRKAVGSGLRRTLHPYLNSKLFISVLFTLSPSLDNNKSTVSTLRFAEAASLVKVTPIKNQKKLNKDQFIQQLQEYSEKLQHIIHNQKLSISQLQEQLFESQLSGKKPSQKEDKDSAVTGMEDEKVNEKITENEREVVGSSTSTPIVVTETENKEKEENNELMFTIQNNVDDDNEWKADNAQMKMSVEESLQLEKEFNQEMSHDRRLSRAQDITLLQFVENLEKQQEEQPDEPHKISPVREEPEEEEEEEEEEDDNERNVKAEKKNKKK